MAKLINCACGYSFRASPMTSYGKRPKPTSALPTGLLGKVSRTLLGEEMGAIPGPEVTAVRDRLLGLYGFSIRFCMTTSLARGGPGLGTCGLNPASSGRCLRKRTSVPSGQVVMDNPFNNLYEVAAE